MIRNIAGTMAQFTPSLVLDFTKGMPSGLSYSGPAGTRVNASGLIESVAANTPRIDYDPVTLSCKGLLIEESRTNSFVGSTTFGNGWAFSAVTATTQGTTTLDGSGSCTRISPNIGAAVNSGTQISQSVTTPAGYIATTIYAKSAGLPQIEINNGANGRALFNLQTGLITNVLSGTAIMTAVGNGWYRCGIISPVSVAAGTSTFQFCFGQTGVASPPTFNGTLGVYIYGAQVETGSFATSYIPTTTAAVTRAADVCNFAVGSWYNASQGAFVANYVSSAGSFSNARILGSNALNSGQRVSHLYATTPTGSIGVYDGTTTLNTSNAASQLILMKAAMSYSGTTASVVLNAGTVNVGNQTRGFGGISVLYLFSNISGEGMTGWFQKLAYYPNRLPNSFLQSLTQ